MANTVYFKPDKQGIREISKSEGMCNVLLDHAIDIAQAANADASTHASALGITEFKKPPYAAAVDELKYTAVGVAHTTHRLGGLNESKHKSLSNQLF